jgi:Putative DNA-binding domain
MNLARTQQWFWRAVIAGQAAPAALLPDDVLTGDEVFPAQARLRVYSQMYVARLVDALRDNFPAVAESLGPEKFQVLSERFLRQLPPVRPKLAELGREWPAFLETRPKVRPALADLARLEWARNEVFFEADVPVLSADAAAALGEGLPGARLRLIPGLRLLSLRRDVTVLWRALRGALGEEKNASTRSLRKRPTEVVVWKKDLVVYHVKVDANEAEAIARALAGGTFAHVCEAFATPEEAFGAIATWFNEGWVRELAAA